MASMEVSGYHKANLNFGKFGTQAEYQFEVKL